MEKHTVWELKQKQSLSLDAKIQMTRLRLKQWHISMRVIFGYLLLVCLISFVGSNF